MRSRASVAAAAQAVGMAAARTEARGGLDQ